MSPFLSPQILSQCLLNHELSHQKAVNAKRRAPPKTGVTIPTAAALASAGCSTLCCPGFWFFSLPSTFKGFKLSRRTGGQENPTRWFPKAQSIRLSAFLLKGDCNCRDIEEIAKSLSVCNQLMRQRTASPAVASPLSAPVSLPHFPSTPARAGGGYCKAYQKNKETKGEVKLPCLVFKETVFKDYNTYVDLNILYL